MTRPVARGAGVVMATIAALAGLAAARPAAPPQAQARAQACHSRLSVIAHAQGSPDDLVWDGTKLLVSDINQGTVGVVSHGHVRTLVGHISLPEGIVPGPRNSLIIAAQGKNSVIQVRLPSRKRRTLASFPLPAGAEGIDGINADGASAVFVPDSARGRLYVVHLPSGRATLFASGMIRPVAAIKWHGAVVIADEYANAVWRIGRSHTRTKLASILLPDDLAVVSGHLIVNSLAGQVWEAAPHLRLLTSAFKPAASDPQGMVADGSRDSVTIADQSRNTIYRLSHLTGCL